MFSRIGSFVVRRAKLVLLVSVLALAGAAVLGVSAFAKLQTGGFDDPDSESSTAQRLIESEYGGEADLVVLVTATAGTVDSAGPAASGTELAKDLAAESGVTNVVSYWDTKSPGMKSDDGRYALIVATGEVTDDLTATLDRPRDGVEVTLGGANGVSEDVGATVGGSLAIAEAIAVPIILILLVIVFGSVVAALIPLAIGGIAILGTFAELSILGSVTDVAIYAINITTALGLGLAIDYGLLAVSRFREELASGSTTEQAVIRTVATAGRTIVFSGATVAVALAVLLLFPLYFLRSFAYAGIGVVIISVVAAIVVLPALLAVLGPKVNAGRLPWAKGTPSTAAPIWGRIAGFSMRRPVLTALPIVAVLIFAALPLLRVDFGTPDDRVLPNSAASRQVGDVLRSEFGGGSTSALDLVTTGPVGTAELTDYAEELSALAGVTRVESSEGVFVDGQPVGRTPMDSLLVGADTQRLTVMTDWDSRSDSAQDLVASVREMSTPSGVDVMVAGSTAALVDTKDAIGSRLPLAIAMIVLTTFVLLFLFTGSILQPLRSLVLNALTLSATLGVMVWIFQDGHLASFLGFTPSPLDTSMLMLLFCVTFGLSMDYEVFVMSRIKELNDGGADNRTAVTSGLTRSGRIVSAAAVLMAVQFFAFGTADVSFLQLFGIGSGLAVLIDATLIRGVLVPAAMRLLGRHAWYSPRPLKRLHARVGLAEA